MLEEDRTTHCLGRRDPAALYEHYLRQLVLVASHGDDGARRLFVRTHRVAFEDALTAQRGSWPDTLMGFRLAVPVRPPYRRSDAWAFWKRLGEYQPAGLALDPVCNMFVDPTDVPYTVRDGARTVYLCCPRCLAAYVPSTLDVTEIRELPLARDREVPASA
ncbi:MAG: hypothetical protein ACYC5Q_09485 [Thermoleophilia bacterium]